MKLAQLLEHVDVIRVDGAVDVDIISVTRDSRVAQPSQLFVAIRGAHFDGHEVLHQVSAGAILVERPPQPGFCGPVIYVKSTRVAFAQAAAALNGHAAAALTIVGITGTNGKTTISTLVDQALSRLGRRSARIGTLGTFVLGQPEPSQLTTPEADQLHALFASMRTRRVDFVCMEVSSIGLDQGRVEAIPFSLGVFTNLSRDHLDFHGTMDAYRLSKARLFTHGLRAAGGPPRALLCADDPSAELMGAPADRWTYGFAAHADIRAERLDDGARVRVITPRGEGLFYSPLFGSHNLQNLLGALGILLILGLSFDDCLRALERSECVPGRLEPVLNSQGLRVLVDYAHTPDALQAALRSLRPQTAGRLIVVFGAGGDRDPGKRSEMGQVASEHADLVVVTSDNPRTEDPDAIVRQITSGLQGGPSLQVQLNRRAAIAYAVQNATPRDTVLIAGKGHETYQEINGERRVFDDRVVAREEMERL